MRNVSNGRREEEIYKPYATQWINDKFFPYRFDHAEEIEQKQLHIDGRVSIMNKPHLVEIKGRNCDYPNILLEEFDDIGAKHPGWFHTTTADLLVYLTFTPDWTLVLRGHTYYMKQLYLHFRDRLAELPIGYGHTYGHDGSLLYDTQNRILSLEKIPDSCVLYSEDVFGLPIVNKISGRTEPIQHKKDAMQEWLDVKHLQNPNKRSISEVLREQRREGGRFG